MLVSVVLPPGVDWRTCDMTTTPSFEICTSVSIASTPTSTASLNASIVFSGQLTLDPRCAIACGFLLIARVNVAAFALSQAARLEASFPQHTFRYLCLGRYRWSIRHHIHDFFSEQRRCAESLRHLQCVVHALSCSQSERETGGNDATRAGCEPIKPRGMSS